MENTSSSQPAAVLTSLPLLDAIRNDPSTTWTRDPGSNLDVRSFFGDGIDDDESDGDGGLADGTNHTSSSSNFAICHLDGFLPFTQGDKRAMQDQFEEATAIALAAHHLNTGDGSIVPQVLGLNERCPIRFTVEFADTEYSASAALEHVVSATSRPPGDRIERLPCAFIGAYRSSISIATSILTSLRNFPQISGASTSADLDDKNQYPLFGRTIPSDHGNAVPVIQFMRQILGITHLAVLNQNDAFGNSFVQGLRLAAEVHAPDMQIHQATVDGINLASIRSALSSIKDTKYKYIFGIVFTEETHDILLTEAYEMGMAGTGQHQWFFGDSFANVEGRVFEVNSPLHLAYRGVGMLEATGGVPNIGLEGYEKFLKLLAEINNPDDLEYLFSIFPTHDDDPVFEQRIQEFRDFLLPVNGAQATFLYEAAIALGLAACQSATTAVENGEGLVLDGKDHFNNLVSSVFQGVNGDVVFDPQTGSKEPSSTLYKVTNFLDFPTTTAGERGVVQFNETFTHIYKEGAWRELSPFTFNDGSTQALRDIPPVSLDNSVVLVATRVTVILLSAIIVILGIGLMAWTQKNRKSRVVLASQPFFLHTLCIGAMIMGCTIIPLSIDHGAVDLDGCTIACTSVLWLGALGFSIAISALFTKTHRINIILSNSNRMQRIKVTIWDVAKPMMVLLSLNTIILSVMSAVSPTEYELIVESQDEFGRPDEIRGQCNFRESLPYVACVVLLNFGALVCAIAEAFKARNLSVEFAESAQIFRALITIIMVLFVGGPVLLLARDNANTFVFVASAIIFVTCSSILLLLFVPKIIILRESRKKMPSRARLHISGINLSAASLGDQGRAPVSTDSYNSDGDAEEFTGMKILTTKTPEELVKEIYELKRLLKKARAPKEEDLGENVLDSSLFQLKPQIRKKSILRRESKNDDDSTRSQSNASIVSKRRRSSFSTTRRGSEEQAMDDSLKATAADSSLKGSSSLSIQDVIYKDELRE